jgi:hypothetical protein
MSDEIKLLCWVQGDRVDRGFVVRIKPSNTIADLKEAIRAGKPSFQQIDADSLQLWHTFQSNVPDLVRVNISDKSPKMSIQRISGGLH